ncbi:MAG: hypothetical protein WCJ37_13995 [Syntrophus sp. (in: bacteria)]
MDTKKIRYRKAIVTLIDILGFTQLIKNSSPAEIVYRKLEEVRKSTKSLGEGWGDSLRDFLPQVFQFSDTIIRVRFTDTNKREFPIKLLCTEIGDIAFAQMELINQGVLMRGGMGYGDVCITDQNVVFGPAYIDAHNMESKYAIYPRIIISSDLMSGYFQNKIIHKNDDNLRDKYNHISDLLRKGDDGIFYVDYATAIESKLRDKEDYLKFLRKHRILIIEGCNNNTGNRGFLNKYLWLATYHNSIVSKKTDNWFKGYNLSRRDLLITKDDSSYLHDLG